MAARDPGDDLAALETMSSAALRRAWAGMTDRPRPRVSPKLLRMAIAWEVQTRAHGGLPRRCSQKLEQLAAAKTTTRDTWPGMRLAREWNGKVHVVLVGEDGIIRWNEREWKSLSEVARAITGTRWSGPAFFGLRQKRKVAA